MLSPIIASFLNACFVQGRLPTCMSSALVTPIHKKGPVADPANYRPIAVGEPLYRAVPHHPQCPFGCLV